MTHPVEFGKAVINWQDLADGEYGHWVGELAPSAAATFTTGGAAAVVEGGEGVSALTAAERTAAGAERVAAGGEFDMVNNPGPLADDWAPGRSAPPAATFAGGKYNSEVLDSDRTFFRAGDSKGQELGQFFTSTPPQPVAQVRIDRAVRPRGSTATAAGPARPRSTPSTKSRSRPARRPSSGRWRTTAGCTWAARPWSRSSSASRG